VKFILPTDVVLADKFAADANTKVVSVENIPDGWMGLDNGVCTYTYMDTCVCTHTWITGVCVCVYTYMDNGVYTYARVHTHNVCVHVCVTICIGPESTKMIQKELSDCKTIIWNGIS
jgi:phosphoglycerate kinase